jgi:hypothetical protein
MELDQSFLHVLDSAISSVVTTEPVEVWGEWSTSLRRTYRSEVQQNSGSGPFVEVEDKRWNGTLSCEEAVGGMGFLVSPNGIHWAKGPTIQHTLPASLSLHAYAACRADRASFTAGVAGTGLPSIPVEVGGCLTEACVLGPSRFNTGRVTALAQVGAVTFAVVIFPRAVLKMGRNHLWSVRNEVASQLPPRIRDLLTHGRGGDLSKDELWSPT